MDAVGKCQPSRSTIASTFREVRWRVFWIPTYWNSLLRVKSERIVSSKSILWVGDLRERERENKLILRERERERELTLQSKALATLRASSTAAQIPRKLFCFFEEF